VFLLLLVVGVGLYLLVSHEPSCYRRCAIPPGEARKEHSTTFRQEFVNRLLNGINNDPLWGATFTQAHVNSYFAEDFLLPGHGDKLLPEAFTDPRVTFEADRIRVGVRYSSGWWSTVISLDMRVWVPTKEPNVVAVEIQGMHLGALPILSQS